MKRTLALTLLLALAVTLAAACTTPPSSGPSAVSPAAPATGGAPPATLGAATPQTVPASPLAGSQAPKPGALQSYVAEVEIKQEAVKPNPGVDSWVAMEMSYSAQPAPGVYALQVTDKLASTDPASAQMQMIVTGQDAYILTREQGGKWVKSPTQDSPAAATTSGLFDPNRLAQEAPAEAFTQANIVNAHEAVSGEDSTHYRVQGATLAAMLKEEIGDAKLASGQMDIWVSNAGGYIKGYAIDIVLDESDGREVRETGQMQVTGANQPVNISTPTPDQVATPEVVAPPEPNATPGTTEPGAESSLAAVPAPAGAKPASLADLSKDVADALQAYITPGLPSTIYLTDQPITAIFDSYRSELPKQGWSEVMSGPGSTVDQPSLLMMRKGAQNLQIVIMPDAAKKQSVVFVQVER